mmetsp:Transcript_28202/g.69543  ORF Transcript_28202/g.69543 Transcript_28202/m.69543 type:complete len:307 (-) Transcript_28202:992-1912(-)
MWVMQLGGFVPKLALGADGCDDLLRPFCALLRTGLCGRAAALEGGVHGLLPRGQVGQDLLGGWCRQGIPRACAARHGSHLGLRGARLEGCDLGAQLGRLEVRARELGARKRVKAGVPAPDARDRGEEKRVIVGCTRVAVDLAGGRQRSAARRRQLAAVDARHDQHRVELDAAVHADAAAPAVELHAAAKVVVLQQLQLQLAQQPVAEQQTVPHAALRRPHLLQIRGRLREAVTAQPIREQLGRARERSRANLEPRARHRLRDHVHKPQRVVGCAAATWRSRLGCSLARRPRAPRRGGRRRLERLRV